MKTQFTSGPWRLEPILIGDYDPDSAHPDNRIESHCIMAGDDTLITYDLPPTSISAEFLANGRLMVESPAMYAVLQMACDNWTIDGNMYAVVKAAREIINRIEGKEVKPCQK